MNFGIEKCTMLSMKKGRKKNKTERTELHHQKSIRTLRKKENNKLQGILEVDTIKQMEMKEKVEVEI